MRALIVGWGSIGRRHARCLRAISPDAELVIWRSGLNNSDDDTPQTTERWVYSAEEAIAAAADFAIIANPATMHVATALAIAEAGIPLLIEKPLSDNLERVRELRRLCSARSVPAMVGYVLRFHPLLQAARTALHSRLIGRIKSARLDVGQYLPDWRPGRDWRKSVSARRELGGGVLLELSHEIDLACWLFGNPVEVTARIPPPTLEGIDVEDAAELLVDFESATLTSIHLDMVRRPSQRSISVLGTEGMIEIDLIASRARHWSVVDGAWHDIEASTPTGDDIFVHQLLHFLDCLGNGKQPDIGLADGEQVLRVIAAARRSSSDGCTVRL